MGDKITKISDHSGKEIDQVMTISIEVAGYSVKDSKGNYYNRIISEIHPSEVKEFVNSLTFEKPDDKLVPRFAGNFTGSVMLGVEKNG
jgi:hypothetical protein